MATRTVPGNAATPADRKRVKVYELKNNDWYDRGTGFCTGHYVTSPESSPDIPDGRILVASEEDGHRSLLETRITKDDGYQKQQDTLIVWTETNGVDMALSFQEADGCASIWEFVSEVQGRLAALATPDGLSDDLMDPANSVFLPEPQLGRLDEVEAAIRAASATPASRDALTKFVMHPEQMYILKLAPLVARAEELESIVDLHRLCTVMKHLILLNDSAIIEFVVMDQAIMGVVGALEYDPDFPSHRANHRQWLSDTSRFKQVVPIEDEDVRRKIHWTHRLLYLKDVVLARILDDPTFSVLNSLIFFNQVDIVNHLQNNQPFLQKLFAIFAPNQSPGPEKKKEAVLFIQNCCAISKNIQAQSRAQLYQNFIYHGLFAVITYALRHLDASVRVAGTDILVALIDHDPHVVRNHIFNAVREKTTPLTDTLIELLLVEVDLGVKSQMADAIKILLDPMTTGQGMEMMARGSANGEIMAKRANGGQTVQSSPQNHSPNAHNNAFLDSFFESSAKRLFAPLKALEHRPSMLDLSVHETALHIHLVDILTFFVRPPNFKGKFFILSENLHSKIAQLLLCPQKYIKLTAIKWFRTCIGLNDEFHNRQMFQKRLFEPILDIVEATMPRNNLLNSACLDLFNYIGGERIKQLIVHLVESYRERLMRITYVETFQTIVLRYDQMTSGYSLTSGDESTTDIHDSQRMLNGRYTYAGLKEPDDIEDKYFNGDDDIDDDEGLPTADMHSLPTGASPMRPLVDYPDDDEMDEGMDILASSPDPLREKKFSSSSSDDQRTLTDPSDAAAAEPMDEDNISLPSIQEDQEGQRGRNRTPVAVKGSPGRHTDSPPEPLAIKRRRAAEDDDDELGKMMGGGVKRRNSSVSLRSNASTRSYAEVHRPLLDEDTNSDRAGEHHLRSNTNGNGSHILRRKGSLKTKNASSGGGKLAIKPIHLAPTKNEQHAPHQAEQEDSPQQQHHCEGENADPGGGGADKAEVS